MATSWEYEMEGHEQKLVSVLRAFGSVRTAFSQKQSLDWSETVVLGQKPGQCGHFAGALQNRPLKLLVKRPLAPGSIQRLRDVDFRAWLSCSESLPGFFRAEKADVSGHDSTTGHLY